jgi:hypothetical protein
MIVCGVIGGGLPLRTSNRPEKRKPFYHSKCFSFIPLNSSVRRENYVKKSRNGFALLKSLGTDRKSKMERPEFVNIIALGSFGAALGRRILRCNSDLPPGHS